jgi:hypothetical protein
MAVNEVPDETAGRALIAKLNQFRSSLSADEQQMLDALIEAARQAHEQGDVEVYWFSTASSLPTPGILAFYGPYSGTATYSGMQEGTI